MSGWPELPRLLGAVALLLAFGALSGGRLRPALHAGQSGAVALAALWQAAASATVAPVAVAVVLAAQVAWVWPSLRRAAVPPAPAPVAMLAAMLGVAVLAVVLATVTAPEGMATALAVVLLGLLGAASGVGPFGALCLLNGAMLMLVQVPRLPLLPLLAAGLAGLAVLATRDGVPRLRR